LKKALILLFVFISGIGFSQSKEYSGIVKAKSDSLPIPGAIIIVKGTKIETKTDLDGNFKISVPDSLNILSISYLGFQTLEYDLKNKKNIEIFLKEDCTIHWFDQQLIGFNLNSGLINNPVGGQFRISFTPNYNWPTIKAGISYQTNLKENRFLSTFLNFHHLFVSCDFDADINSSYKNMDYDNNIEMSAYSVETSLNFNNISTIIGLSTIDFDKKSVDKKVNSVGTILGFGTWIGRPFLMSVSAKTTIYKNLSEYQAEIKKDYRGFYGFIKYYKVNTFNELSLGIGYEFWY